MSIELNQEERTQLANLVIGVLDEWGVQDKDQVSILGLPEKTKAREITRFRKGGAFPQDDDVIARSRHILGIQHALHLVFAQNPYMPSFWVSNPNNRHFGRAPLAVMLDEGLGGLERVRGHLDCTENWV